MVATAFATQPRPRSNVAGNELVLRVSGSARDGQIVRLKSEKCTIGAGRHCTLRLRAPGVAPLHCLIVRGRAGAVARRWSPDTMLNHQAFADALLSPGDRLSVGPIELEVLDVGADPQQPPETGNSDDFAQLAELDTQRQSLERQRGQWQTEQEEARRQFEEQHSQLAAQAAEFEAQRDSLAEERRGLQAEQNALAEQRREWESRQEQNAAQTTGQTEQLQTQLAELDTQRQSLERQLGQWRTEQEETRRQFEKQHSQLAAQAAEFEAQRDSLAEERHGLQAEQNALAEQRREWEIRREQHLAAEVHRSEESRPDNGSQAVSSDAAAGGEPSPATESQELEFQAPAKEAPVDLADVFRRVGAEIDSSEGEKGTGPIGRNGPRPTSGRCPASHKSDLSPFSPADVADVAQEKPPSAPADKEDEESIDEYMSRLMQRVQASSGGTATSSYTPPLSAQAAARKAPAAAAVVEPMEPSSTASPPAPQRREPAPVAPRAKAPEKQVNLSAMRELANFSAHSALSRHSQRLLIGTMYSKLLVAMVALAAAAGLLWMWKTMTGWQMTYYSALVALIVAIYWGLEYALLSGRLMINKSGHIEWAAKAAESNAEKSSGETASGGNQGETASGP